VPRTKAQIRSWWYPVIEHHSEIETSVKVKYRKTFPAWLDEELNRFSPEKWLRYWDRKTGKPKNKLLKLKPQISN